MLTQGQFERTRRLALRLAGIELLERHRQLLARRSGRLGIDAQGGFDALLDAVEEGQPTATRRLVGLVTTNFTGFFRHPGHFEAAAAHALRAAQRRGEARLWSAAAATGEEAYSLALALIQVFGLEDPPVSILATDIDAEALAAAESGEYGESALRGLEPGQRARFFTAAASVGRWAIAPAVRRLVEFRLVNLAEVVWPIDGPFDVIFCRNVLMYLEAGHRHGALVRVATLLAPEGLLILDPTEHVGNAEPLFASRGDGIFSFREKVGSGRARTGVGTAGGH
jgi:chemotaxis protein methyltransferase CheR